MCLNRKQVNSHYCQTQNELPLVLKVNIKTFRERCCAVHGSEMALKNHHFVEFPILQK